MQEEVRVVLDAMGGDHAPEEMIKGAVEAVNEKNNIHVLLVGQEDVISEELEKYTYPKERMEIVHASEVIETAEPPVMAIRKKKDSSIVVGMNMVKNGEADAFVSAGSSGAILVGGQVIVGRIKGIERPPLAPLIPTEQGVSLLVDCGANGTSDRLRSQCGCQIFSSCSVCKDGFYLYGTCHGHQKAESCDRQHRSRGRKRKCTGKRDISTVKRM